MEEKANCENCSMRAKYDQNPRSLLGRFWRWHINFCPGWKSYFRSLDEIEKQNVSVKYNLNK